MIYFLIVLTISAVVTYAVTPLVRTVALTLGVYTPVRDRDMHRQTLPRWGGAGMFLGMVVGLAAAAAVPYLSGIFADLTPVRGVFAAMVLILIVGMADDAWDIHWFLKLIGQIGAGVLLVIHGVRLEVMPVGWLGVGDAPVQAALTVFLVVLTINAFNFIDGLDGLAAGVAAIGGSAFFIYSYLLTLSINQFDASNLVTLLMAVMVGACLGFLPHNFHPARIIMGDTGAMLLGLVMAAGAVAVTSDVGQLSEGWRFRNVPAYMPILLPLAVTLLPLLDLALAVIRRTARGASPFSPDRGHLHHKLVDGGYSHPQAVLLLYLWSALFSFGAVSFSFLPWWFVSLVMLGTLGAATALTLSPWLRRRARRVNRQAAERALRARRERSG
ncbi:MraY family glycosyltransferase [Nesterenkonia xinjiangensis]|uniref:UDP-GlcNAc:undecaprenyl-phosphate GlcNAc-1-phosphate transferase n=1 Tax=Nesterenkonia xinjiangensis TaxID=225327 RepID=A0A7Z0GKA0_9MICC|nr:MraY family glycosyltransferase [Nesterenkonia xinjiangensis]NYJ76666.1 UDP-GlcNAc:undecaprenyl-phosphate GlcNAc-1-phosphate transferase [Nesterenkonia xinjiangensis]